MNILSLTLTNIKTIEDRGIYTDLLRKFNQEGHSIYIISPIERRYNQETELIDSNDIKILRVKIGNITKTNLFEKTISTLQIESKFLKAYKSFYSNVKFDLILYSTPPITFGKVVKYVKRRTNAKTYLLLKDIFPQNAVDLKMISKLNPIYFFFRKKEKKLYRISDYIGCMSQANVDYIKKNNAYLKNKIIEECPNSIEPKNIITESTERISIRTIFGIPDNAVVFLYGGNLGRPQGVDFLMKCLLSNKNRNDIFFFIIGSGTEYEKINSFINTQNIDNTRLLSQLPKDEYDSLINACDVGLIFLDNRFTIPNFPSRLLSYMEASIPILAATDINTDVGKVIESNNFGFWCESKNVDDFNKLIDKLLDENLRNEMGKKAREYLIDNYTVEQSYEIIMKHFSNSEVR